MRRELALAGALLVVYACALVLGTLVICGTRDASELPGWRLYDQLRDCRATQHDGGRSGNEDDRSTCRPVRTEAEICVWQGGRPRVVPLSGSAHRCASDLAGLATFMWKLHKRSGRVFHKATPLVC